MQQKINRTVLELDLGDITETEVDVIVNAANPTLLGGGGVDGAIHSAGGREILDECKKIRAEMNGAELATGKAVITTGGRLPAKHVIHTVGPVYGKSGNDAALLASAYRESLRLADKHGLKSIAFPSISTGAYGYPLEEAAPIALGTVAEYLQGETGIELVRFVLFNKQAKAAYVKALEGIGEYLAPNYGLLGMGFGLR